MQLSEAIEGWLDAHDTGLSPSTRRDIGDIAASADRCGYGWMDCVDVRPSHQQAIIDEADAHSALNADAIGQFLDIVVDWALAQPSASVFSAASTDDLPSDTDSWLDDDAPPVVDDLDLAEISWVDDLPPLDEPDPAVEPDVEPEAVHDVAAVPTTRSSSGIGSRRTASARWIDRVQAAARRARARA